MAAHPIAASPAAASSPWYRGSSTCNRAYLMAGVRAGLIALVLLAGLLLIILF